ncbi:Protein of unknown function [[Clostridium] aminophilum]|uniref:DUF2992 family protein n=1 Tax=[Clostridium] aminophilum TaxID=1526 RepID=A0A1I0A812_9FIRM|nr:YjdF family protein [[Clostridium] aminophilum]SES90278.1 Protein of unknown function [[Clostridium] aminophilum]
MDKCSERLTVFFEEPFWVGIFELEQEGHLSACKVTFGAEPKDWEIRDFILREYDHLSFSPAVAAAAKEKTVNPKRRQREAHRHLETYGIGTKAQQALKMQQEQNKLDRRAKCKTQKLAEQERLFDLKQQKKRAKHRGR